MMRVWGADPLICPCCKGTMKVAGTMIRREEVEFFLRLHGMWEGIIALPPPPDPPYDIETMEPLAIPPQWGWTDGFENTVINDDGDAVTCPTTRFGKPGTDRPAWPTEP